MKEFNTTLLREKFIIRDPTPVSDEAPVIALSNRLVATLPQRNAHEFRDPETFVVRAQNMHSCIRMAARLAHSSADEGPVMDRKIPFRWDKAWEAVIDGYEKNFNPNRWVAVYHKGKPVFSEGEHHPFLDIIEACDAKNQGDYESSIELAEEAFKKAGKVVNIDHDANIALVVSITDELARCGIILRGADKTTTFNFTAKSVRGAKIKVSQSLTVSAAFLEGIQLAFQVGMGKEKLRYDLIEKGSEEAAQIEKSEERLKRLTAAVNQYEHMADVNYRPERPNFFKMAEEAEDVAKKILAPQIKAKIESGELNEADWVM